MKNTIDAKNPTCSFPSTHDAAIWVCRWARKTAKEGVANLKASGMYCGRLWISPEPISLSAYFQHFILITKDETEDEVFLKIVKALARRS